MQSPVVGLQLEQWVLAGSELQQPDLSEARNLPVEQLVQIVLSLEEQSLQLLTEVLQQASEAVFKYPEEHPVHVSRAALVHLSQSVTVDVQHAALSVLRKVPVAHPVHLARNASVHSLQSVTENWQHSLLALNAYVIAHPVHTVLSAIAQSEQWASLVLQQAVFTAFKKSL